MKPSILGVVLLAGARVGLRRQGQERRRGRPAARRAHRDGPDQDLGGQGPRRRPPGDLRRRRAVRARRQGAGRKALRRRDHRLRAVAEGVRRQQQVPAPQPLQRGAGAPGEEGLGEGRRRRSRRWRTLAPNSPDTKDALFQLGATYAEMGNWPTSATIFAQLLERKDMTADDKIEAMGAAGLRAVPAQGPGHRRADVLVGAVLLPQHREGGAAADRLLPGPGQVPPGPDPPRALPGAPAAASGKADGEGHGRQGAPAAVGAAPVHRDHQDGQPAVGVGVRLPGRVAVRGVLRLVHPRADPARADGRRPTRRSARSTTRSCGRRSGSCWRSRCARTSRTC